MFIKTAKVISEKENTRKVQSAYAEKAPLAESGAFTARRLIVPHCLQKPKFICSARSISEYT